MSIQYLAWFINLNIKGTSLFYFFSKNFSIICRTHPAGEPVVLPTYDSGSVAHFFYLEYLFNVTEPLICNVKMLHRIKKFFGRHRYHPYH